MPTLSIYDLGQGGVNVDATAPQVKPNEARQLQNAILDADQAVGGLRKRGGLQRFNAAAINGGATIHGGIGVPLPSPGDITRTYYASLGTAVAAERWATSTNGTTWTVAAAPERAVVTSKRDVSGTANEGFSCVRIPYKFKNKLWYPTNEYTVGTNNPSIRTYDGTDEFSITEVPESPVDGDQANFITSQILHDGEIYLACHDPGGVAPNHRGRVFTLDATTGALTQIGNEFSSAANVGGFPMALASFMGQLFCVVNGIAGASTRRVYRIRPGVDTTWTTDLSEAGGYGVSMAVFKGDLYIGCRGTAGSNVRILRRTPAGAYTTVESKAVVLDTAFYTNLFVFSGTLYAHYFNSTTENLFRKTTDGTTWSDDFDLLSLGANSWKPGGFLLEQGGGAVLVTAMRGGDTDTGNRILRNTGSGFSSVYTGNVGGFLEMLEVQG